MRAEQFELTSHVTRVHVPRLGRDYDLTQVSDTVAEQLIAAGCTRLRRKPALVATETPANDVGPAATTASPTEGKKPGSPRRRKPE